MWVGTRPGTSNRGPGKDRRAAAIDTAAADFVDWLAQHHSTIDDMQGVGGLLADKADGELARSIDGELAEMEGAVRWKECKGSLLDHFWCDLLAAFAVLISNYERYRDQIPRYVENMILESRERAGRRPIGETGDGEGVGIFEKFVVRSAVRGVWKILGEILLLGQTAELVRVIRILAILLCPAPENHPAVYRQCIAPFVRGFEKDVIKTATKERLDEILPSDWLSSDP